MRWTRHNKKPIFGRPLTRTCGRTITVNRGHGKAHPRDARKGRGQRTIERPCPGTIVVTTLRGGAQSRFLKGTELRCNFCGRTV